MTTLALDPTVNPDPQEELTLNLWCMLESWKKILLEFIEEDNDTSFVHWLIFACDQIMDSSKSSSEVDSWKTLRAICNFALRKRIYVDRPTKLSGSRLECGIFMEEPSLVTLYWYEIDSSGYGAFVQWTYYISTKKATVKWHASKKYPCMRIAELICWDGPARNAAAE